MSAVVAAAVAAARVSFNRSSNHHRSTRHLEGLVDRLRVAFEENEGQAEMNPFSAPVVRLYLTEVKEAQAKGRGIAY
ncbi:hypothetical protein V6N11_027334 [Hibiscus sabdariffa]|uniref:ALOG domain-containing protein n=1 Tax=Hibiscus sabdariffa TaxID=183260 RepID=A0ABR2PH18_9ROSI